MLGEKHQGTQPNKAPVAALCGCRSADSLKRHHSACKNRMKEEANEFLFLQPGGFILTNDGCGSGRSGFTAPLCQPVVPITQLWQVTETIAHSARTARG